LLTKGSMNIKRAGEKSGETETNNKLEGGEAKLFPIQFEQMNFSRLFEFCRFPGNS
jgi:hypothetical protein